MSMERETGGSYSILKAFTTSVAVKTDIFTVSVLNILPRILVAFCLPRQWNTISEVKTTRDLCGHIRDQKLSFLTLYVITLSYTHTIAAHIKTKHRPRRKTCLIQTKYTRLNVTNIYRKLSKSQM